MALLSFPGLSLASKLGVPSAVLTKLKVMSVAEAERVLANSTRIETHVNVTIFCRVDEYLWRFIIVENFDIFFAGVLINK